MARWIRFEQGGKAGFGTLEGDTIAVHEGDMFAGAKPTGGSVKLADVEVRTPCDPSKMICLWNNFHQLAAKNDFTRPKEPLWFLKAPNAYWPAGKPIERPATYAGKIIYEGELGVVIGKKCFNITEEEAGGYIFGYTCVNDVTAVDLLRKDKSFEQWARAKSFDTFGVFGPVIETDVDPMKLSVKTVLNGKERQNYPVADMFFPPHKLVAAISKDVTLMPGDVIACGTSLGAGTMGDAHNDVSIVIDGVGTLSNVFDQVLPSPYLTGAPPKQKKICVVGAGAIGGLLAAKFALAGEDVTVIDQGAHLAAIQKNGLKLEWHDGKVHTARMKAVNKPAEAGKQDIVVLAVKAHFLDQVVRDIDSLLVPDPAIKRFDLAVKDFGSGVSEVFEKLSIDPADPRYVASILAQESQLVRIDSNAALSPPTASAAPTGGGGFADPTATAFAGGGDGGDITDAQIPDGLRLLDQADLFNLLCIPPLKRSGGDLAKESWDAAIDYAKTRRAFVIVDPPERWTMAADVVDHRSGMTSVASAADNAALYFPRIVASDPLNAGQPASFAPCGAIAGIFARIDGERGVWKAPAGDEADLRGVLQLSRVLSDSENGLLNPAGINALRSFAGVGNVVWGARTLKGADALASEWKYIPVRRLVFYIEESISRGTKWAVFEPNAEPLWAALRLNVGAFMHGLFTRGALQGQSAREAYFVKCGQDTTTQADIDRGIVNVEIGLAPLKPAEFVIIRIQQMSAIET